MILFMLGFMFGVAVGIVGIAVWLWNTIEEDEGTTR